jgi:cadmium resistance protein CadD (predicted permease)
MRDRFFTRLLHGTLPLIIWAAHFFAAYMLVAAQCSAAAVTAGSPRRWMLGALSLLAIGACAALLWRARTTLRHAGSETSLLDWAAAGSGVLATAGIAWTSIPMLLVEGCK